MMPTESNLEISVEVGNGQLEGLDLAGLRSALGALARQP